MKRTDKLLTAIFGGIAVLIVAGLAVLFLLGGRRETTFPENTPEGVVQRFVLALENREAETAYGYLSTAAKSRWSQDDFHSALTLGPPRFDHSPSGETSTRAVLSKSTVRGDRADIVVTVSTFTGGGPFSPSEYTREEIFTLKMEGGQWRIESFPEYEYLRPKEFRAAPPVVVVTPIPVTPTPTPQPTRG